MSPTESSIGSVAGSAVEKQCALWRQYAFSNAPVDKRLARQAVDKIYRVVGLDPPRHLVWVKSPIVGAIAAAVLSRFMPSSYQSAAQGFRDQFSTHLWTIIERKTSTKWWQDIQTAMAKEVQSSHGAVTASIRRAIFAQVAFRQFTFFAPDIDLPLNDVMGEAYRCLASQLPQQYKSSIEAVASEARPDLFGNMAVSQSSACGIGALDPDFPFYDFCRSAGFKLPELDGLMELARAAGWWWPFKDVCIVMERPRVLCTDERGRLHNSKGPALAYADGWTLYAWHGELVPERFIAFTRNMTVHAIFDEINFTLRRRMIDIYGLDAFMLAAGARRLQEDECGELMELDLPGDEPILTVKVRNSTPEPDGHFKYYFLRVPPNTRTARQGIAWTFGMNPLDYKPIKQT